MDGDPQSLKRERLSRPKNRLMRARENPAAAERRCWLTKASGCWPATRPHKQGFCFNFLASLALVEKSLHYVRRKVKKSAPNMHYLYGSGPAGCILSFTPFTGRGWMQRAIWLIVCIGSTFHALQWLISKMLLQQLVLDVLLLHHDSGNARADTSMTFLSVICWILILHFSQIDYFMFFISVIYERT